MPTYRLLAYVAVGHIGVARILSGVHFSSQKKLTNFTAGIKVQGGQTGISITRVLLFFFVIFE